MADKCCCTMASVATMDAPASEWTRKDWRHLCNGYAAPVGVTLLIMALIGGSVAVNAVVIRDYPDATWRVAVSAVFLSLIALLGVYVLITYWCAVGSRPGYVQRDPWRYRPHLQLGERIVTESVPSAGRRPVLPRSAEGSPQAAAGAAAQAGELAPPPTAATPATGEEAEGVLNPLAHHSSPTDRGSVMSPLSITHEGGGEEEGEAATASRPSRVLSAPDKKELPHLSSNSATAVLPGDANVPVMSAAEGEREGQQEVLVSAPGDARNPYVVRHLDRWGELRYCGSCMLYKPDRAYHCTVCRRCVYANDHHCLWLNTCIGRNNYKLFMCFIMTAGLSCDLVAILDIVTIFVVDPHPLKKRLPWIAVPVVLVGLGILLTMLWIQHRCFLCKGKSTVDNVVGKRIHAKMKRTGQEHRKLTASERVHLEPRTKEQIREHTRTYWGDEAGIRALLPIPFRTDDTAEGCPLFRPPAAV